MERQTKKRKKRIYRTTAGKGMTPRIKGIIAVGVLVIVLAAAGASYYLWDNSFVSIDLAAQTSIALSGYNGRGSAEAAVEAIAGYLDFFETVEPMLDKQENLHNGETVTVSYTYDEALAKELKLRVDAQETSAVIDGLAEPDRVSFEELFEPVRVTFSDLSPMITADVEIEERDSFLKNVTYTVLEPKERYSSGDKLVIEAEFDEELAFENACEIEAGENGYRKEYDIATKDAYVMEASEITPKMVQEMYRNGAKYFDEAHAKEYGLRIFSEARLKPMWENKKTFFSWVNPRLVSAYFNAVTEEGKAFVENHANDVKIVYEATLTQPDGLACNAEVVVQYTDLVKYADGTIDLKLDSGKIIAASYRNKNIKSIVSDTGDGHYISTKLDVE